MQRRSLLKATARLATASLAGPAIGQDLRARTLRMVPQANLTSLDPCWTTAAVTENHGWTVFDTLFGLTDDLQVRPQMAAGHQVSDDRRPGPSGCATGCGSMTANRCWRGIARRAWRAGRGATPSASRSAPWWRPGRRPISTLRIRLKSPFPLLLEALAKPSPMSPSSCRSGWRGTDPFQQVTEMVGSGPYRFLADEYVSGSRVVYARNDAACRVQEPPSRTAGGKQPHFERIEWTIMPDSATASAALQSGEIDWWEQVNADLIPALRAAAHHRRGRQHARVYRHLPLQPPHPPLDNPAIRRALLHAINQEDYVRAVTGNDPDAWRVCHSHVALRHALRRPTTGSEALAGPRDLDRGARHAARGRLQGREGRSSSTRPTSRPSAPSARSPPTCCAAAA